MAASMTQRTTHAGILNAAKGRAVHQPVYASASLELRVCTNRTCKRQGSQQVVKMLRDLSAGHSERTISVTECGCLGNCGSGPNMVLLPAETVVSHVATPTDAAEVLKVHCGVEVTPSLLQATQLRVAGNSAAQAGDLDEAIALYSQALALGPPHGRHLLHSNRCAALMELKRPEEAAQDALMAVQLAPGNFTMGWVRLIDCLYALGRYSEAGQKLTEAETHCLGFKQCPEYKSIVHALRSKSVAK